MYISKNPTKIHILGTQTNTKIFSQKMYIYIYKHSNVIYKTVYQSIHTIYVYIYIHIYSLNPIFVYIYMPDGCQGDRVFSKTGRFGVHPKGRFGDRAFSHYKNRHFRGKVWQQQKRPKVTNCPLPEPRAQFCRNTRLNLCTGHLAAKPL